MVHCKNRCFFLWRMSFKKIMSLQHKLLHCDELTWTLLCISIFWIAHFPWTCGFTSTNWVASGAIWFLRLIELINPTLHKGFREIDPTSRKLEQLSVTTIEESCIFSRAVVGDLVKMLLPSISNTVNKCLPKNI